MTENEMIGWHHHLNGHGFGWTLRVGDGQGVEMTLLFDDIGKRGLCV